jgi:protein TonB
MQEFLEERPALGRAKIWLWALLASGAMHVLLVVSALCLRHAEPPKVRRVVPVEAITLTTVRPGPQGGGGGAPAPAKAVNASSLKKVALAKASSKSRAKRKASQKADKALPKKANVIPSAPPALLSPDQARPAPAAKAGESVATGAYLSQSAAPGNGSGGGGVSRGRGAGSGSGTGSGAGSGAGQGSGSGAGSILQGYLREVRRLLEQQKKYPGAARRMHLQGVAVLRFTIAYDGRIESIRLCRSSGHGLLDDAAQETVKRVGGFPPLPSALGKKRLTLEIPLAFRLQNY